MWQRGEVIRRETVSEQRDPATEASGPKGSSAPKPSSEDGYTVRFYRPEDREGFLSLYETVFGGGSDAWLDWKYVENPYVDHVPIIVAEREGEIVGAKPAFALEMRVGDTPSIALQPCDTMVHADHRRRGLYSRMLSHQKEAYRSGEAAFFFNFPNPASMPGSLEAGWRPAMVVPTYYRVQNPAGLMENRWKRGWKNPLGPSAHRLARLSAPLVRTSLRVQDRFRLPDPPDEVGLARRYDVPTGTFASLYEARVPEYVHAIRDERFYEWRFGNPHWDYVAYTAHHDNEPIAGIVVGTTTDEGITVTNLVDVVPMTLRERERTAIVALLDRIVRDHAEVDVLAVRGKSIPRTLLGRYGFRSDQTFPLSYVASLSTLVTRPTVVEGNGKSDWTLEGVDLLDASNWSLSFAELDTA